METKAKAKVKGKSENSILPRLPRARTHRSETAHTSGPTAQMKKKTRIHHGKVKLRGRSQKNLRVWRHLMMREWRWPKRNRTTRWGKRKEQRPTFHCLVEDDEEEQASGGLNHLVQRNSGGAHWTLKNVTFCGRLGSSGERNAEGQVSRHLHRGIRKIQEWEEVQRTRWRTYQQLWKAGHVRQNS